MRAGQRWRTSTASLSWALGWMIYRHITIRADTVMNAGRRCPSHLCCTTALPSPAAAPTSQRAGTL